MPYFTVVIPTYNRARALCSAIDSVLAQSFTDFDLIVIDDGSTDETNLLVKENYSGSLILTSCEHFGGPARGRNIGITLARSQWICFLDSDDWWFPQKLQENYDCIIKHQPDILYHPMEYRRPPYLTTGSICGGYVFKPPILASLLLNQHRAFIPNSSVVVRKEILDRINYISEDPGLIAIEDFDTLTRIAGVTNKFFCIPHTLGVCRIGGDNITRYSISRSIRFGQICRTRLANSTISVGDRNLVESYVEYKIARAYQVNGRFHQASKHYIKSLNLSRSLHGFLFSLVGIMLTLLRVKR